MMYGVAKGSKIAHKAVTNISSGWSKAACGCGLWFQNEPHRIVDGMEMPAEVFYIQPTGTRLCKRCFRGTKL